MLLILTNSQDVTADYLDSFLRRESIAFERINTDNAMASCRFRYCSERPELHINERVLLPSEIDNVWYRRPEQLKHPALSNTPEAKFLLNEWAECFEAFLAHIPYTCWMNHPIGNALASHKLEQLTTAKQLGFTIPATLVTQSPDELRAFYDRSNGRLIVKPLSTG